MSEASRQEHLQSIFKQQMSFEKLFGHFHESALNVLLLADEEAILLNHHYIGTEHLLLGLVRAETAAAQVLRDFGVELLAVRAVIEYIVGRGTTPTTEVTRPFTPRSLVVVSLAISEGWRSPQHGVTAEHLLLALLREGEGLAVAALENIGVNLDQLRTNVLMALFGGGTPPETLRATLKNKSNVVTCRIDNQDLEALDALIEVGIRSTRSDAASWLIHAGIYANRDILESVYTTVAEMRQLRLKAQAIVQQLNKGGTKVVTNETRSGSNEKQG